MAGFNEGGMHFIHYHKRDKEFDDDTMHFCRSTPNHTVKNKKPVQSEEIIMYRGKRYKVVSLDSDVNKKVTPSLFECQRKKKKSKNRNNKK